MWKIAICDDEFDVRNEIECYLQDISKKLTTSFIIDIYCSAEEMLEKLSSDTDILLLDIKMNGLSGIDAARKIRKTNNKVYIIFITTMTQYALEGYEVHAFGFLKKPISYEPLERYIFEAVKRLSLHNDDPIIIQDKSGILTIDLKEIIYIEAYQHTIYIITINGTKNISTSLSELEKILKNKGFFRTHKSYLINMRHIKEITGGSLTMSNGKNVLLSKYRKKEFMESFIQFSGGII